MKMTLRRIAVFGSTLVVAATLLAGSEAGALAIGTPISQADIPSAVVQKIITKGDQEIARRLNSLNGLDARIVATTKLNAADKSTLTNEVNAEVSGLTSLKASLDAATTITMARTNAQSIISDYRVYALVVPKIHLIATADGQRNTEAQLSALAAKLQTRLTAEQKAGKNVTPLESELADMTAATNAAASLSSSVETNVLPLQPSNYNNDHTLLSSYRTQLQSAHADTVSAAGSAQAIIGSLKNL